MTNHQREVSRKLSEADSYFADDSQLKPIIEMAHTLYDQGQYALCEQALEGLPTSADLLASLMKQLRQKSVHKTLKKMGSGEVTECSFTTLKGLSSLMTHVAISCEQGDTRYSMLLPQLAEKIDEIIYKLQGSN